MKKTSHSFFLTCRMMLCLVVTVMFSCKNDIETVQALTNEVTLPDVTGFDIEMAYTDSGVLKGKIISPEVNHYAQEEEPYYEFPKGMRAVFYDRYGREISYIRANFAIYYTGKELWEGRGQVVAESSIENKKVETEQIFWDQKDKRIYSDKFSTVTNADGVFTGENGFEAQEDLSKLRMNGYSGRVVFKEENQLTP